MAIHKKTFRRLFRWLLVLFLLMNVTAFFHAWKFTHFGDPSKPKTDAASMGFGDKLKALFLGVGNPRPVNKTRPARGFEVLRLESNVSIECWYIPADSAIGTVIIFHGYGGDKSGMLDKAEVFSAKHYNVLLPDFMGSGNSGGNQTTIGYKESAEVKTCVEFIQAKGEKNIVLFGTSMGAVAVMKAMDEDSLAVKGIIIECPFGTMYRTVCARFDNLGVPTFPMAGLLVFWGGVQNGFWAFGHNPEAYARGIHSPVLLIYGEKDDRVSRGEIDRIYTNLAGPKKLVTFPDAGHINFLEQNPGLWEREIDLFLKQ